MSRFWVVSRKQWRIGLALIVGICIIALYWRMESNKLENEEAIAAPVQTRVLHMITGEFKANLESGKELEVYTFHPSTVHANAGEQIELHIRGINGKQHNISIEGLNVQDTVMQDKESVLTFKVAKEGIYRIICHTHNDMNHGGPMIGYLVVD